MSDQDVPEHVMIDTEAGLAKVVAALLDEPRYALDTEFHRERTYYPKVALVQIAWPGNLVLIDPLAVSLEPLAEVMQSDVMCVMHAPSQDFEVLEHETGHAPTRFFDTQVAAGFLGMSSPSLSSLHERFLKKRIPKGDRLTDWLARPLKKAQLDYAASDVADLLELHDLLVAQLVERDRLGWAESEFLIIREKQRPQRDPEQAWLRIKEARHLRGEAMGVAKALAAFRERRAAEIDQPIRFILPDLAIVALAQKRPAKVEQLTSIRGVDDRQLKGALAEGILAAVQEGIDNPVERPPRKRANEGLGDLRAAVTLLGAWVAQLARELSLDPALLGTRSDIESFVRGEDSRLSGGWREQAAGQGLRDLLEGKAALAFTADQGLLIEPRPGH